MKYVEILYGFHEAKKVEEHSSKCCKKKTVLNYKSAKIIHVGCTSVYFCISQVMFEAQSRLSLFMFKF